MTAVWAALLLLIGAPDIDARIAASASAAEALHGPLDGAWTLRGVGGRALYLFQIVDPVPGQGEVAAAWRDPSTSANGGGLGPVTRVIREGRRMTLIFAPDGAPATVSLTDARPGLWVGQIDHHGVRSAVSLTRP